MLRLFRLLHAGPFQPFALPGDAGDLAVLCRKRIIDSDASCRRCVAVGLRHHQRTVRRIAEQCVGAGAERFRVGQDLRRHVARIARRAELGDMREQHIAHRIRRLRQRHVELFGAIGRHDRRAARRRDHRDAARLRRPRLGEERGGLAQRLVVLHQDCAGAAEHRAIRRLRSGQRAGVRHRRRRTLLAGRHLEHDERLVALPGAFRGDQHALGLCHAFEHAGDRRARRIVREIGDVVRHIDIAGIAGGQHVAERHAAHHRLRQRHPERARLAHHADRLAARSGDRRDVHECHAHVERRIHHANAVRPDDAHVAVACDRREAMLLCEAVLLAGFRVARGEYDHTAHASGRAFQHDLLHRLARRGDHGAVRHFRQCGNIWVAALIADPLVARIHRIDPSAIVLQVHQHAFAERAGPGGGADHRDAGGMQQPREIGVLIDSRSFRLHGVLD